MKAKICTLLFLRRDDQILLAMKKRGFGANRYNGVGGKVEPGESLDDALIRECQEEIDVTPVTFTKVAEHDFVQQESNEPWRMYVHAYICTEWQRIPTETEEMAPEWFALDAIPYDKMWSDDIYWLPMVLQGKKVKGVYTFDENDIMLTHNITEVEGF